MKYIELKPTGALGKLSVNRMYFLLTHSGLLNIKVSHSVLPMGYSFIYLLLCSKEQRKSRFRAT